MNNYTSKESAERELLLNRHISRANLHARGRDFVTTLLDSFNIIGPCGTHVCMVFDPLSESLFMFKNRFQDNRLPLDVLKPVTKMILEGLRYLHKECHVIHTGIKYSGAPKHYAH